MYIFPIAQVYALTCFKNEKFDYKNPGEESEECQEMRVCVRYIETKENTTVKDAIQCSTMQECSKHGEENKASDPQIEFSCYECNSDKCIPKAPTDTEVDETSVSVDETGSSSNKTTTMLSVTPEDDEDDEDDPDDILYSTEREPRKAADFNRAISCYNVSFFYFITILTFITFIV